eukprot:4003801-Ditylum_brightwellii.AAC.1
MTFCALPYAEREAKNGISEKFGIWCIPFLLILGPVPTDGGERPIINRSLRRIIESGDLSNFPFCPKSYGALDHARSDIKNSKCLVVVHENGDDNKKQEIINVVKVVSKKYRDRNDMKFLWALDHSRLAQRLRLGTKLPKRSDEPMMIILDIPDQGGYYVSKMTSVTVENITQFIEDPGDRQQL